MSEMEMPRLSGMFSAAQKPQVISQDIRFEILRSDELEPHPWHPFRLYTGERQQSMIDGIKDVGVVQPILVREMPDGKKYIMAGNNRNTCNLLAGRHDIISIVYSNLTDGMAKIIMVITNLDQRGPESFSLCERGRAFRLELEGLQEERKRLRFIENMRQIEKSMLMANIEVSGKVYTFEPGEKSRKALARIYEMDENEMFRLIRLSYLDMELQDAVDTDKIGYSAAVPVSYLPSEHQQEILRLVTAGVPLHVDSASELYRAYKDKKLTVAGIEKVMRRQSPGPAPSRYRAVRLAPSVLQKYFRPEQKPKEIADTVDKALAFYFQSAVRVS